MSKPYRVPNPCPQHPDSRAFMTRTKVSEEPP